VYTSNVVRVTWCDASSEYFLASNSVKQGDVLVPVLLRIYLDNLLVRLAKPGIGCYIGNTFVGAFAYADDIVLVSPSATGMRKQPRICDSYAAEYSISFNASKSKCMVISPRRRRSIRYSEFVVEGKPMEFVSSSWTFLDRLDDNTDISQGEASLWDKLTMYCATFKSSVLQ